MTVWIADPSVEGGSCLFLSCSDEFHIKIIMCYTTSVKNAILIKPQYEFDSYGISLITNCIPPNFCILTCFNFDVELIRTGKFPDPLNPGEGRRLR